MKYRLIAIAALLSGVVSVTSCIDPDQTQDVIIQNDLAAIEKYIEENTLPTAKEYADPVEGFYMFWETSVDTTLNDQILRLDTVKMNYTGKLLSNTVFDSSFEQVAKDNGIYNAQRKYEPMTTPLGVQDPVTGAGLIFGFEYAASLMKPGEKATVIFRSGWGYGGQIQERIPANSPLVFELELLEVKNGPNHK